jgi:hypothetical protein
MGNFDAPHLYIQWGGKLPGGEIWSNGVRMAYTGFEMPEVIPAGLISGVGSAIQALHTATGTKIPAAVKLSFIKFARVGVDGHYVPQVPGGQANPQITTLADIAGSVSTPTGPPNQQSIAVTLTTGYSTGVAKKGRFYLPCPIYYPSSTDGLISASEANAVQDAAALWLTTMNASDPNFRVAVFSRKDGAATHRLVTGVWVGRVIDTQRRRRRSLPETYVTV